VDGGGLLLLQGDGDFEYRVTLMILGEQDVDQVE